MKNRIVVACLAVTMLGALPAKRVAARNSDDAGEGRGAGAVFVMTNSAEKNEVIAFTRAADGSLQEFGSFATGGRGSGGKTDPLESQGALTLSQDHQLLLAVNAGSGEISVFGVEGATLSLIDRESSGGSEPNSIAQSGNLVYVLNTGASSEVVGFHLHRGHLEQIPNSTRFLSTNTSGAASIAFSPNGKFLAVVERLTNNIDIFGVQADGSLAPFVATPSAGPGGFSGQFAPNGALIVSETGAAGVPNGSAVSSYTVNGDGTLSAISASVPTLGAANCWNAIAPDGRFVYTGNSASANISGFAIGTTGLLTPLPGPVVGSNPPGAVNLDLAITADGKFLYSLNSGNGSIGIFAIQKDGTLTNVTPVSGLPASAGFQGIAAY
jgi:6-phosphogluconolactonase